jgi:hypothetical protein
MKSLLTWYKALPPQMQMLVAMAGFGTPIGIIYSLSVYLHVPTIAIILGGVALVALVALASYLIPKVFNRSARKRAKKMEAELAARGEAGPVSMDLRAAIKSNNEKFFGAIKDMRKLGISVYDLPWYVVIGDSGCGKTKLINEGGLTFSTGKPEGYQLGTLNYNWWFTEDAIFVDMAGRLCNPQEDADHREWDSFLKTIGLGRKGYPINGVLCCVSAEHLLQDPAEKHEADAHTMLERLRDLQTKLGVTFASYLVITKCDKIVGFMQFFDRAERDITIKNQIFGWSRPGDFNELRDPEVFGRDFDNVYGRLNELRLRRLNDDVDEFELGLAYSFPEEFRQFKEPLQIYVRTLFPAIKNPRAVKNLIFRGVYFTSATQQGGLILRHLTERLGADAASQFPPLESLYPRPRPHFVKDLLFRKVFPERGLVFRNEQEVVRNRKLARVLTIGTAALAVLLVALLITGSMKFGAIISSPRERAQQAPGLVGKPVEALTVLAALGQDVNILNHSAWPYVLSLGIGAQQPVEDLTRIRVRLFEQGVLRRALAAADEALRTAAVSASAGEKASGVTAERYRQAVEQYVAWYACARESTPPAHLDFASFSMLLGVVPPTPGVFDPKVAGAGEQAQVYFTTIATGKEWANPASVLLGKDFDPPQTIRAAVVKLHNALTPYATLTEQHPDRVIAEWSRILGRCVQIQQSYDAILDAVDKPVATQDDLNAFTETFNTNYDQLTQALQALAWKGPTTGGTIAPRIPPLRSALLEQRKLWTSTREDLVKLLSQCPSSDPARELVTSSAAALVVGNKQDIPGLDCALADALRTAGLSEKLYSGDYYENFDKVVREVPESFAHLLTFKPGGDSKGDELTLNAEQTGPVRTVLDRIHDQLAARLGAGGFETTAAWVNTLEGLLYADPNAPSTVETAALDKLNDAWKRDRLKKLASGYQALLRRGTGTALLDAIEKKLAAPGPWTLAALTPDWQNPEPSAFAIATPAGIEPPRADKDKEKPKESAPPPLAKAAGGPPPLVAPPKAAGQPAAAADTRAPEPTARPAGNNRIPKGLTPDFFNTRAVECVKLSYYLEKKLGPEHYLARGADGKPPNQRCAELVVQAWRAYCNSYFGEWDKAYAAEFSTKLERLLRPGQSWESFAAQFRSADDPRGLFRDELQPAFNEALHTLRWPTYDQSQGTPAWLDQPSTEFAPACDRIRTQMENARTDSFKHGDFAGRATLAKSTGPQNPPWVAAAAEFATRWADWCDVVATTRIPRQFTATDSPPPLKPIPWEAIPALRKELNLGDERITRKVADLQTGALTLLSAELTAVYTELQDKVFASAVPFDGWPYLNKDGTESSALETADFQSFTQFLLTVQRAQKALEPLEQGMPQDDPVATTRRKFLAACQQWRDFLVLKQDGPPAPLDLTVWTEDPLGEPLGREPVDDTPQHYYAATRLALGLLVRSGDAAAPQPLEFKSDEHGRAKQKSARWEWTRVPEQQTLTFELVDGLRPEQKNFQFPNINPRVLGRPGPLALCAYLHRYGKFDNGNWVVTHSVNLPEELEKANHKELRSEVDKAKPNIGQKFIFQLGEGKKLPDPISKLTTAPGATTKPS